MMSSMADGCQIAPLSRRSPVVTSLEHPRRTGFGAKRFLLFQGKRHPASSGWRKRVQWDLHRVAEPRGKRVMSPLDRL